MVHATLRLLEEDGTVYPPEVVEIITACPDPTCGRIEVRNEHGEPLWVTSGELSDL